MNKVVFLLFLVALSLSSFYAKRTRGNMDFEWALLNIEALAFGEDSNIFCFGIGSLDCPNTLYKVEHIQRN
jgi:hypothetical protein